MKDLKKYLLLDSGDGQKLEQVGEYLLVRPCSLAIWKPSLPKERWDRADAVFSREEKNKWAFKKKLKEDWIVEINDIKFKVSYTDFGHLGIFPEHSLFFPYLREKIKTKQNKPQLLNLFAYTGGITLAAAKAGAKVCHLDASFPAIEWAKENALLNNLQEAPIRWIVDDAKKFLKREIKRQVKYDGIVLDPPTFGRGKSGQVFKIETDLFELLTLCKELLSERPLFIILSCHTPGFGVKILKNILSQVMQEPANAENIQGDDLFLANERMPLPSGNYVIWEPKEK